MIEWGNTPAGSLATLYLRQVSADDILALADELYFTNVLGKQDSHTITCRTGSITYASIHRPAPSKISEAC